MTLFSAIEDAIKALRQGIPVLIYDDASRENEVDYVVYAGSIDADLVYEMRVKAGGLICYAMSREVAEALGLRFAVEYYSYFPELKPLIKIPRYGEPPAFSIWVNHVSVETGIRDKDKAITLRELHNVSLKVLENKVEEAVKKFREEFMIPGHVPILIERGLHARRGHTELSLALMRLADLPPSAVLVEMLAKHRQLSLEEARRFAREHGYPLIHGRDIVEAYSIGTRRSWVTASHRPRISGASSGGRAP